MTKHSDEFEHVAEQTAQHLLERAASLDADRQTLADLRDAAVQAGISATAFDAAIAEWRAGVKTPSPVGLHRGRGDSVVRNVAALSSGYVAVLILTGIQRMAAAPWIIHKLADPLGLALGAFVAVRLRARSAATVLGGVALSQFAEFLMEVRSGAPALHGFGAHMGLMIAGVAAVALGARFWRRFDGSRGPSSGGEEMLDAGRIDEPSRTVGKTNAESDTRFLESLRLRRNMHWVRLQPS